MSIPSSPEDAPPPLPRRVAGYEVLGRLGEGGMGQVLLARKSAAHGFHKRVAIKLIRAGGNQGHDVREMFFHEARLAARLDHANICQVFDFGEAQGSYYIVMEYLSGVTLTQLVRAAAAAGRRLDPGVVYVLIAGAARGLHHAHGSCGDDGARLGVVHRDITPSNLFITYSGTTKLLDFGIALSADRAEVTATGAIRGKPGYVAPEAINGVPLDAAADLFSLGAVLHEALTGERLFQRDTASQTVAAVLAAPIPDPRAVVPDLEPETIALLGRMLARERAERLDNADEVARQLEALNARRAAPASVGTVVDLLEQLFPPALRPDPATAAPETAPTSRRGWLLAGGAALALAAALPWIVQHGSAPTATPPPEPAAAAPAPPPEPKGPQAPPAAPPDASEAPPAVDAAAGPSHPKAGERRPAKGKRAAAPAKAAEAAEAPAPPGAITVVAEPYGQVIIDGVAVGNTPLMRHELSAGEHVVEVRSPDTGAVRLRRAVTVAPGANERVVAR